MADREEGDDHGLSDVAHSDGRVLYFDIRMAAFRRVPFRSARQVLRTVHGRCIIQLSPAGEAISQLFVSHSSNCSFLLEYRT